MCMAIAMVLLHGRERAWIRAPSEFQHKDPTVALTRFGVIFKSDNQPRYHSSTNVNRSGFVSVNVCDITHIGHLDYANKGNVLFARTTGVGFT